MCQRFPKARWHTIADGLPQYARRIALQHNPSRCAAGAAVGLAEKICEGLQRGPNLPATGVVEKEGVNSRLDPICENSDQATGGKLRSKIRKRQLHKTSVVDCGGDGDAGFAGRQGSIHLDLEHAPLLAEAPRNQRAACVPDADAGMPGELLRSLGRAVPLEICG